MFNDWYYVIPFDLYLLHHFMYSFLHFYYLLHLLHLDKQNAIAPMFTIHLYNIDVKPINDGKNPKEAYAKHENTGKKKSSHWMTKPNN